MTVATDATMNGGSLKRTITLGGGASHVRSFRGGRRVFTSRFVMIKHPATIPPSRRMTFPNDQLGL